MKKEKAKMATKTFNDKPIWEALQILEKRITQLDKKNNAIINKVNQMCIRFGISKL